MSLCWETGAVSVSLFYFREMNMKKMLMASLFLIAFNAYAAGPEQRVAIPLENSPSRGPENALVTIVEFIDFQ
jgi:hypothetical protein